MGPALEGIKRREDGPMVVPSDPMGSLGRSPFSAFDLHCRKQQRGWFIVQAATDKCTPNARINRWIVSHLGCTLPLITL